MARSIARSFVSTKSQRGPDVARYIWMLIIGIALMGSSLAVLFARH